MLKELYELCPLANWGSLESLDAGGWIGLSLHLVVLVGLLAGLTLLVVWAVRRARIPAATGPHATGQPTTETVQTQYGGGKTSGEQSQLMKQGIG